MSSGNQQLGFAIRAVNEASSAIDEVTKDLGFMESAAAGAEPELKDLSQALGQLQTDVQDFASELEDAGGKFTVTREGLDQVAEGAGNLERVLIGSKDILGVLEEQFGVSVGPMVEWSQAAADVAGGVEGIISGGSALVQQLGPMAAGLAPAIASTWAYVTALLAQAAAFIVANAPILLLVAGIALLVAGVVLAVKHWGELSDFFNSTVTPAFTGVWEKGLKPVVDFVRDHWPEITALVLLPFAPLILVATDAFGVRTALVGAFNAIIGFVRDHWPEILTLISGPFFPLVALATNAFGIRDKFEEGMTAMKDFAGDRIEDVVGFFEDLPDEVLGALGDVGGLLVGVGKSIIQGLVDGMKSIPIPNPIDMIPGAGKVTGAIGKINPFAGGTDFAPGGLAIVGEDGPELVDLPRGSRVFTASETRAMAAGGVAAGGIHITIQGNVYGVDDLAYQLDRALKRMGQQGLVA